MFVTQNGTILKCDSKNLFFGTRIVRYFANLLGSSCVHLNKVNHCAGKTSFCYCKAVFGMTAARILSVS